MNDVRYMRTADPDQSDKFATANKIERQGDNGALVTAQVAPSTPFFLYTPDQRAVASFYGFVNTDPYAAAAYATEQAVGYAKTVDQTLNLTFGLGALKPGESTKITMYLGVTDNLGATLSQIDSGVVTEPKPPKPVNLAPVVVADNFSGKEGSDVAGNVLANDRDPEGAALTAKLKSGPANGTIEFSKDGSFIYTPDAGFSGSDSFIYVASDGVNNSGNGIVRLSVSKAPVDTVDPLLDLLKLPGLVNGSSAADQVLSGVGGSNVFYFASAANTGNDRVTNFGHSDLLVVDDKLRDSNDDGIIKLAGGRLSLDAVREGDTVQFDGVSALRFLGTDGAGRSVYADASVRPGKAQEGTFANDTFGNSRNENSKDIFFFDTALNLDLGQDAIVNFGVRDRVITTSKLSDGNNDGIVNGTSGKFALPDDTGTLSLSDQNGATVDSLMLERSFERDDVAYYVYAAVAETNYAYSEIVF
ncbi:Ig-like domain-containing protein [Sphingomonas sp. CFBP 13720]|uniref:Ig-like domain-containing protein n=1 Tax=Sphingomonas sp. CFBP 13720 TaxID=2775302 RepID=UPI00406C6089